MVTTLNNIVAREIAFAAGLTGMSLVAVMLRIFVRFKTKVHLGADDCWILACAILDVLYMAVELRGR